MVFDGRVRACTVEPFMKKVFIQTYVHLTH